MSAAGSYTGRPEPIPSILLGPPEDAAKPALASSDQFHARHRRLRYVMDFFKSKEFVMKNEQFDMKQRVLEAAKLTAWANFCDYAADENGRPLSHTALADLIGASTQRVSESVTDLVGEFCLRVENRVTYVIDDPELERKLFEKANKRRTVSRTGRETTEEKAKALAFLKEHDPHWFSAYQEIDKDFHRLCAERKEKEKEALLRYRAAQAEEKPSGEEESQSAEPVSRPVRETETPELSRPVREDLPDPSGKTDDPIFISFKSYKKLASYADGSPEKDIDEVVEKAGLGDLHGNRVVALRNAARYLSEAPDGQKAEALQQFELDCRQLAARRRNKPKNFGIIVKAMEDAVAAVSRAKIVPKKLVEDTALDPEPEMTLEEQIRSDEEFLTNFPDHQDAETVRQHLDQLQQRLIKRKPIQREGSESIDFRASFADMAAKKGMR